MGNACISHEAQAAPHQFTTTSSSISPCREPEVHTIVSDVTAADVITTALHSEEESTIIPFSSSPQSLTPQPVEQQQHNVTSRPSCMHLFVETDDVSHVDEDTALVHLDKTTDDENPVELFAASVSDRRSDPLQPDNLQIHPQQPLVQGKVRTQGASIDTPTAVRVASLLMRSSGGASLLQTPKHVDGGSLTNGKASLTAPSAWRRNSEVLLPVEATSTSGWMPLYGPNHSKDSESMGVFQQVLPLLVAPKHFLHLQHQQETLMSPRSRRTASVAEASTAPLVAFSKMSFSNDDDDNHQQRLCVDSTTSCNAHVGFSVRSTSSSQQRVPSEWTGGGVSLLTFRPPTLSSLSITSQPGSGLTLSSGGEADCLMKLPRFPSL